MKITEYSVKNPQMTILIFSMIIILGLTTILTIPRSEDPELSSPEFPVVIIYPGTSPKDMEGLVIDPLESKLTSFENIKRVTSTINDGLAVIWVQYKHGSNVDEKYQEVVREVNNMRNELPSDIYSIDIQKWLPSNVNIMQIALVSENASLDKMKEYSKKLKEELEKIPQLKNVKVAGLPEKAIRIELKLDKMNQMHVPLDAVIGNVQSEAINIPGGNIDAGNKSYNIQTSGNFKSIDEIKNTIVYSANNNNVYLKDIANVFIDYEKPTHITRLNSHRAVFIVAAQKPGENITATKQIYLPILEKFRKSLPANIDMVHHFDQAENVNNRLAGLGIDFLIAIAFVSITLLPLGYRAAMIVMISIPLSLSMGLILINFLGYNLNQLTIVGFVVALGLLVDDSIVVVENIERWLREGHSKTESVIKATKQIGLAVLGCTAALIIAFMPLAFLPGASGDFIRSLPVSVISTILASLFISLTLIPFLSNRLLKNHAPNSEGNFFLRLLKKIISGSYAKLLDKALQRPILTLVVAALIFFSSLAVIPVIGFSIFPASEKPQLLIEVSTPLQSNIDFTDKITKDVETELLKHPEIKFFASNIGKGNPQIYYNELQANERTDFSQIFVQLEKHTKPDRKLEIIEELRNKFITSPDSKIEVKNFEQGPPVAAPIEIRIFGNNLDSLRSIAAKVETLLKNTEGTIYIKNPLLNLKSDIQVKINKEKASMLGISIISIDKTIRLAVAGMEVGKMTDEDGESYNIKVTRTKESTNSLDAFKNLYVNNYQGKAFPLSQVAELRLNASPVTITHDNKIRTVSVISSVKKGFINNNVINDVIDQMDNLKLPEGYSYEMGGEISQREDTFGGFSSVIIATIFLFITVLVLEFKTFKSTIIVLSVIPLGIVGAIIALLVTGNTLSFIAVIGFIALVGVEVKNTILLVDFTNQLRSKGKSLDEAIREAGEVRFLPIVLTSLTAIGGLSPIAISTNPLIAPLAIVLIGGLISSTLLSRIVTPVVYKLIPPKM